MTPLRELARFAGTGVATALTAVAVTSAAPAVAGWTAAPATAAMPLTAGRLLPPTGLNAAGGCAGLSPRVSLSWTPTASGFATGYGVFRRVGSAGSFVRIATLTGRQTSTFVDSSVLLITSYTYQVASERAAWSTSSAGAAATTPLLCL